jgi:hypothetical protein
MKQVGWDMNGIYHVRVESLDEVSINYVAQSHHQGIVMATTTKIADVDVVTNVKP